MIVPDWQNIFVFADNTVDELLVDKPMTNDEISNEEQSTEKELDASILTVTTTKRDIYIMEVLK